MPLKVKYNQCASITVSQEAGLLERGHKACGAL